MTLFLVSLKFYYYYSLRPPPPSILFLQFILSDVQIQNDGLSYDVLMMMRTTMKTEKQLNNILPKFFSSPIPC